MPVKRHEVPIEQAIIRDPLTIASSATVADAIALMSLGNRTCNLFCEIDSETSSQLAHAQNSCILVTEGKKLIGILTERDLVKLCGQNLKTDRNLARQSLIETSIAEVMIYPVHSLLDWEFVDILVPINRFERFNIRHLPLVNNLGEVVGLLTHESLRQLLRPIDMLRLRGVKEVMTAEVTYAHATDSVTKIASLMSARSISSVVIIEELDSSLLPIGIITEGDIVQYLALELDLTTTLASEVMSSPVARVSLDDTLWDVRELMQERMINHVIVTDADGYMAGVITQSDLLTTLQPMEVYKLVSTLEAKMSLLEQEKLELLESRNKLLESQVKESHAALVDSNDMFRQFAENNQGVIVICDASSGKALYVSPSYERLWGKSVESLYQDSDSWINSIHPEDIDRVAQSYGSIAASGFFSEEYRIVCPDGVIRWMWGRYFPIKNAYGKTYRIAAIIEDVSDRKESELALKKSEREQKALINALPDLIIRMSGEGVYLDFYSTDTFTVFGGEEQVGTSIYDISGLSPQLIESRMQYVREVIRTGDIEIYEQEIVINDELHTEEVRIAPSGENEVLVVVRDITDRKRSEIALRQSEQKLRSSELLLKSMFTSSAIGIAITDINGKFVRANPFYQKMIGYSESELISMKFSDSMFPEDIEENLRLRNQVFSGQKESYQIEKRLLHRDGRVIWVRTTSSKILDKTSKSSLMIGVIEDISDRKQAEESLQSLVEGTAAQTGENFLPNLVEYIATSLNVRYVFITKVQQEQLKLMVSWVNGEIQPVSVIPLENSPCALTMSEGEFACPQNLEEHFTDSPIVQILEAESYLGVALVNAKGKTIGSLCIVDDKPLKNLQRAKAMLRVFAARVCAEIDRQDAIAALYQLNQQLESRVEQRTRELKFANQQLIIEMAERQKLIAIVENCTDFIALAELDGQLNYINTAGRELSGVQTSIKNLSIFDFHFPEDHQELKQNILDSVAQDKTWEGEFRIRHFLTQKEIPVLFSAFPVQNSWSDDTVSLACIVRDISDRKIAEAIVLKTNEELLQTNTELARATKLKDDFLANMSHELRTPLNAILGMSEGLLSEVFGEINERQVRAVTLIETSGQHLLELINDVLDVAKIGSGLFELEVKPVSIQYLCKSSLDLVKQMATQKNIQLKLTVQPNIGVVDVDERRMMQALINLLSNAVKFTPNGGDVSCEVKLIKIEETILPQTKDFPYALVFSVIDNGIGIAAENISKLFQTFVQIDSSLSRQYTGTGLGLTLVKQIVELHGGLVTVNSQVGKGSCFSILLPHTGKSGLTNISHLSSQQSTTSNITIDPNGSIEQNTPQKVELDSHINPLILLADDSPLNVETFSDYLTNRGYRLIFACNGQEAVDMTIAQIPDLILMDIQMPVLNGYEAIKLIRANPKLNHIKILALTALAMDGDREKCIEAGADDYLSKPVKLSLLATIIQQQLKKARA